MIQLQINGKCADETAHLRVGNTNVMLTPPINEDYWLFRVAVSDDQAIVAFPKFGTIGIGFQVEEDWNTNLPYSCDAQEILDHIRHNKGNDGISDKVCLDAIRTIQDATRKLKENT